MEYHPKFKKRIQQTAQAAKWSLFHTGMFLDGITTLNWAGIQIYGGYKRFRPESITAYCIGLNSSTSNMRGKFDVAWNFSPKFYDICEVHFPADPCASSILATLPRLYGPLWMVNSFSENPQQQKTKAAIWSLNHMEMFSEWHYNTDMSWHRKIWRTTKAFTWYRHCFFFPKYEIKIGSWENKLSVGISPGLAESVLRGIKNYFSLEFHWENASSSLTSLGHIASHNSRGQNFGKRPQHLKTQKHGNDGLARRHQFTVDMAKGDVL